MEIIALLPFSSLTPQNMLCFWRTNDGTFKPYKNVARGLFEVTSIIPTLMGAILLDSLVWNQYSRLVYAEVKVYKYRFPILLLEVFWKQH